MFHDDCLLNWNSSQGFTALYKNKIFNKLKDINEWYVSFTYRLRHLLKDDNIGHSKIYYLPYN